MKRTADLTVLLLGAAAVFAILSGQAAGPATGTTNLERAPQTPHTHGSPHQLDRPARAAVAKLTPEMIDLCMEVAHDIDQDLAKKLATLRTRNVKQFEAKLRHSRRLTSMADLKKRDPNLYTLKLVEFKTDAAVARLAAEARSARKAGQASEAKALEDELRGRVILQLGFRHRARQDYLCQLRELVERLERELKDELTNSNRMIDERMAELLRDPSNRRRDSGTAGSEPALDQASRLILPDLVEVPE